MRRAKLPLTALGLAAVVVLISCGKTVEMPVSYVEGDIFLHGIHQGTWELGENKYCQQAKFEDQPLLLCGADAQIAWSLLLTEESTKGKSAEAHNLRDEIYRDAKSFKTTIRHPDWETQNCYRTVDGLSCN